MLKFRCLILIVLFSFIQFSCVQHKYILNKNALLEHVKVLSSDNFEGRKTDTEGSKQARTYIIKQFEKFNVKPFDTSFEQSFGFSYRNNDYKGTNILGIVKGSEKPDKYIIISAHYDHLGVQNDTIFNGADDNASGVSALIAFAEYFKKKPPKHSVILAAFDAEELGLEGSKYYVNNPIITLNKLIFNINMDMISRSNENELFMVKPNNNKLLNTHLKDIKKSSNKIKLSFGHDGYDSLEDWTYASDHASFYRKQIPFLYFGVADHKDYHKSSDDYENIHPEFYKEAVKTIISVFENIDYTM